MLPGSCAVRTKRLQTARRTIHSNGLCRPLPDAKRYESNKRQTRGQSASQTAIGNGPQQVQAPGTHGFSQQPRDLYP